MGWAKSSFGFFNKMLQKNPKELFGHPSIWPMIYLVWLILLQFKAQNSLVFYFNWSRLEKKAGWVFKNKTTFHLCYKSQAEIRNSPIVFASEDGHNKNTLLTNRQRNWTYNFPKTTCGCPTGPRKGAQHHYQGNGGQNRSEASPHTC